jgi:hypothetical protein
VHGVGSGVGVGEVVGQSISLEELNQALEKELISQFYEEEFQLNSNVFEHILSPNFDERVGGVGVGLILS